MAGLLEKVPSGSGSVKIGKLAVRKQPERPSRTKASVNIAYLKNINREINNNEISFGQEASTVLMHLPHVNHAERYITSRMTFMAARTSDNSR